MPGLSGTPRTLIRAWFLSNAIPDTTALSIFWSSSKVINVPFPPSCKLLNTRKRTLYFPANSTERICKTLLPKLANSNISSNVILSIRLASGTTRGSVV